MSQAEELLSSVSEELPVHTHPVPDTDTYFIIDPITRKIENTNHKKNVIMQYDHNSERLTFELPRYIDGHDMLECTSVTVNVDNIEVIKNNEDEAADVTEVVEPRVNSDAPDMTDLRVHPDDSEKVISSWLISRNSTQLAGILSFHIEYKCVDSNGNVVYEWSTDTYDETEIRARKKNGASVVTENSDLLEQWRTRIFGAGDSVMANIAAEGEAQVAAVKAESETQQDAVELKGTRTLDSIPEDYTAVDAMADEAVRSKSNAIVCEAEGEVITISDSSYDHIRGLKLFGKSTQKTTTGKNLLDVDESVTFEYVLTIPVSIPAGTYVLSYSSESHTGGYPPYVRFEDNATGALLSSSHKQYTISLTQEETVVHIYSNNYNAPESRGVEATVNQLMLSIDGGTYEPYTGGKVSPNPDYPQEIASIENPTVNICGKNLLRNALETQTINGLTFTVNADKSVTVNGTCTSLTKVHFEIPSRLIPGTNYILSGCPSGGATQTYALWVNGSGTHTDNGESATFTYRTDLDLKPCIRISEGCVANNLKFYPMIRLASDVDTTYEPYAGGSLPITHSISGIPVTSGGNYTDENGQQWICDEIDLERGVYVQRVEAKTFRGNDYEFWGIVIPGLFRCHTLKTEFLCDRFHNTKNPSIVDNGKATDLLMDGQCNLRYGDSDRSYFKFGEITTQDEWLAWLAANPLEIVSVLTSPIETPLTAEEITAFKALRTNYPNTTILNDAGAWMSVKYNADTKSYVDNPKTLRLTDTSTGVVYELKIVDGNLTVTPI